MITIPNKNAYAQVMSETFQVCNGTGSIFPASIGGHPKVMIGCDYSIHVLGGANGGVLKLKGQQKIGDGDWTDGQLGTITIKPNSENRYSFKFNYPHYAGVDAGVEVHHRVLVARARANDQITLHKSLINPDNCVPTVTIWNQYFFEGTATYPPITTWVNRTPASDEDWNAIAYGNGLFVAVASSGTGNRVMTSPDGVNWTSRSSASDESWDAIAYGNGLFVAVDRVNGNVMTSPDGINWTATADLPPLRDVTYGNGLFAAAANNSIYTSTDGVVWTQHITSEALLSWNAIAYGNGLFVAVADSGTGNRVITSPDGTNWTSRSSASDEGWDAIAYGDGMFVAVAGEPSGTNMMTSPDGVNWTAREITAGLAWAGIDHGDNQFVAVASDGTTQCSVVSVDGITWSTVETPSGINLKDVAYGDGLFVAVGPNGVITAARA